MMRIGGDFEITMDTLYQPSLNSMLLSNNDYYVWTDLGRSAIYLAIIDLIKKGVKRKAYLPFYACHSILKAFDELDFQIEFYSQEAKLNHQIDLSFIEENSVFFYINYFGMENRISESIKYAKKKRSFYVIEDCVQSAFSIFAHHLSDYKIYSFRKFLAQADGALLISKKPLYLNSSLAQINSTFLKEQTYGKILRNEESLTNLYLNLLKKSEYNMDHQKIIPREMSAFSKFLMSQENIQQTSERRRENWYLLLHNINQNHFLRSCVEPLFQRLENCEVPLGFPIRVNQQKRDIILKELRNKEIFCPVHWDLSEQTNRINKTEFEKDYNLSKSMITLPIDQRLSQVHIYYLIESLDEIVRRI